MLRPTRKTSRTSRIRFRLIEQDEDGVGAERAAAGELRQPGLEQGERHHREGGEQDDESLAAPPADVSRLCGNGRWLLPIPHERPDDRERRGEGKARSLT